MPSAPDTPAIVGGKPVRTKPFPKWPVHGAAERKQLLKVLESGDWWCGTGKKTEQFEQAFAEYHGAKYAIACTNGSTALEASLLACGIAPGEEVITTPYTFVATAGSILRVNAVPVFVDIMPDTANMDPDLIEKAITPRTAAIMPVHFAGLPCDMDKIRSIARKHKLKVIEDACHAWGGQWKGKGLGAVGDIGCFSFQMSKNLTAGEGGIILTNSRKLANLAGSVVHVGRKAGHEWYEHFVIGSNLRMTEWQSAVLIEQLKRLPKQQETRLRNTAFLDEKLSRIGGLKTMASEKRAGRRSVHIYIFRVDKGSFGIGRDRLVECLNAEGIPCHGGYPFPLYRNPVFQDLGKIDSPLARLIGKKLDYKKVNCPEAERICKDVIWIKQSTLLGTRKDMRDIVTAVKKIKAAAPLLT